jgi:hypothetical protein
MTMTRVALLLMLFVSHGLAAQTGSSADTQIAAATQAAPADRRAAATVLGYDDSGAVVTLRRGTNDLVCLADDPRDKAFSVACYHKDLEPFMARGRALAAQGVDSKQRQEQRWKEIEAGTLAMPREPRMLYVLSGSGFDAATATVTEPYLRWVIYTPFATAESTGLPTDPKVGEPWLMFPGTAGAHIMISPPRDKK